MSNLTEKKILEGNIPFQKEDEPLTFLLAASLSRPIDSFIYPDGTTEELKITGLSI